MSETIGVFNFNPDLGVPSESGHGRIFPVLG